jgi:hypothetical protein
MLRPRISLSKNSNKLGWFHSVTASAGMLTATNSPNT